QTLGSGISIPLAVGTPSTGSGNLYCQWELFPNSGNALCILFPTKIRRMHMLNKSEWGYTGLGIDHYAYSCDELALIRCIFFAGYGVLSYDESKSRRVSERAFMTLFGQDNETFTSTMFLNLDQLQRQLDIDEFQEDKSMATFWVIDITQFRETLLQHMGNVKKSVTKRAHHQRQYERRVNNKQMQTQESKIDSDSALDVVSSQALDTDLVIMESNRAESGIHDTSSNSGNCITYVVDANIRPVNDQVPFVEYLLEKIDSNTSPGSTNISHRRGEIDQDVEHDQNEKLNKENEHLKQTHKELFDLRIHTKDHNDSLIAQVNSKTVKNADLKAQIQEKVFANAALKNELRKLKLVRILSLQNHQSWGNRFYNHIETNQLLDNRLHLKSERCKFSKPRFASQVDVINDLSKPVTPHYEPKVREFVFVKPHHVIASSSSRNSSNESYGSNDMAHKYYLEVVKKKTQDKNTSLKPSVRHTTSLQNTTNGSKPKPRSNNQTSRSFPIPKSSCGMSNGVPLVAHSRNSSSFSDSDVVKNTLYNILIQI
nr:hypothetical protein [Tanacetum cinerariifolium]